MDERFATELLKEIKANAKRWFIAFCVMVAVEIATIFGFLWYITLPVEEGTVYTQESDDSSYNQIIGGNYNGGEAVNKDIQTESGTK